MADIEYEFESTAQEECYDKVAAFGKELYGETFEAKNDSPVFAIRFGSALVGVAVKDWGDEDATVSVFSWVITGVEIIPDLLEYLLKKNYDIGFGAFSIDEENDIHFEHTIVGSTLDKAELRASILAVAHAADSYDDEIKLSWGGERAFEQGSRSG